MLHDYTADVPIEPVTILLNQQELTLIRSTKVIQVRDYQAQLLILQEMTILVRFGKHKPLVQQERTLMQQLQTEHILTL